MGGTKGQKIRLLYLADIFRKYTDEEHPLSSASLIEKLEEYGISAERKAIYDDISVLCEYGLDIIKTRVPYSGFYLSEREFEIPEIYLLSDAVQAASFISRKKTVDMIEKLEKMLSRSQAKSVSRSVYIDNRNKCSNEEIFYNIDAATRAIESGKKLSLTYCRREIGESGIVTQEKKMIVSPYGLLWSGNHYYLVCNNEKYDNLMHLRLDRMKKVSVAEGDLRHFSEVSEYKNYFDIADYAQKTFNMFGGELKNITLLCDNAILEQIIDRFTDKISIRREGEERFSFTAKALISDGLIDFIMQFSDAVEVIAPADVREMVQKKAERIWKKYQK
ncbi:MAG: WYL domain-containing protein [Clostridia bacterium]|nr:WYL domain-containing protein [Clostridia bacterium]